MIPLVLVGCRALVHDLVACRTQSCIYADWLHDSGIYIYIRAL